MAFCALPHPSRGRSRVTSRYMCRTARCVLPNKPDKRRRTGFDFPGLAGRTPLGMSPSIPWGEATVHFPLLILQNGEDSNEFGIALIDRCCCRWASGHRRCPHTRYGRDKHALVQVLREAQAVFGWLPRELLGSVAAELGLTLAHVESVATFYRFFHTKPVGAAYRVLFSDNVTDRMQGSAALLADLCKRLGVERGQVRADRPGQRGRLFVHGPVRSGSGAVDQPSADRHPARCRAGGTDREVD